jgi:hypothetical protein
MKLRCYLCNTFLATIGLSRGPTAEIHALCHPCWLKYACTVGTGWLSDTLKPKGDA